MLRQSAKESGSIVCMGLDPELAVCPPFVTNHDTPQEQISQIPAYFSNIFHEMERRHVRVGAFKPNQGFYVKHDRPLEGDFSGSLALAAIVKEIRTRFPGTPLILDYKRGDIAKSSENYAYEGFESWDADAVTVSPYMGTDSVMPFVEMTTRLSKGVYILDRTSNPGSNDFQEMMIDRPTLPFRGGNKNRSLYEEVAEFIVGWAKEYPGVGAVFGATHPGQLRDLSSLVVSYWSTLLPLLIPGVGSQGGSASDVADVLRRAEYPLNLVRINSSSGITHPWAKKKESAPAHFAAVCVDEIVKLNEQIGNIPA